MSEKKTIEIAVYRDPEGNPTCAVDWGAGHVCKFLRTSKFGFVEHCFFGEKGDDVIERDGDSVGWLRPIPACPLWPSSGRDAARADVERLLYALKEIRRRIKSHPVYEELTLDEEIEVGGDTAEFSYLARVADEAISAAEVGAA